MPETKYNEVMRKGFTLLELVVVVTVIAVIMVMVMTIMANTFKANNRTIAMGKINENGSYALEQIRRYFLDKTVCDGSVIRVTDNILYLNDVTITKNEVSVGTTENSCDMDTNVLTIGFTLTAGADKSIEFQSSKSFTTKIVLRN